MGKLIKLEACHDCHAAPGQPHRGNCDVERCSVCGGQRLCCSCKGHDRAFARWTGFWPGQPEAQALGIDLNALYDSGIYRVLFIKPRIELESASVAVHDDVQELFKNLPYSHSSNPLRAVDDEQPCDPLPYSRPRRRKP